MESTTLEGSQTEVERSPDAANAQEKSHLDLLEHLASEGQDDLVVDDNLVSAVGQFG